jgi:hypothetical protein
MYIVYSCEMTRSYGNEQKSAFCFSLSRLSRLIPMLHALCPMLYAQLGRILHPDSERGIWPLLLLIHCLLKHLAQRIAAPSWRSYEPCLVQNRSQHIKWAFYAHTALLNHMGVNHCGGHILVPEQLLHRPDVVPGLEQVGGKAVPQSVRADRL